MSASTPAGPSGRPGGAGLQQLFQIQPHEWRSVLLSALYFFFVLSSYYVVRPLRDALGSGYGSESLKFPITVTFGVMLAIVPIYGWLASRFPRRQFLPWIYGFFVINLLTFSIVLRSAPDAEWLTTVVWVWVSVFNLFVVAVFWSFMADIFDRGQARRVFGFIAAGGSLGAMLGPALTTNLVEPLGMPNMVVVSAALLTGAMVCLIKLSRSDLHSKPGDEHPELAMGGSSLAGAKLIFRYPFLAGMAIFMMLGTFTGIWLYLAQSEAIAAAFDSAEQRTRMFSLVDLGVNTGTLVLQLLLMGRLVRWVGLALTLMILPVTVICSFLAMAVSPTLAVIIASQIARRATLFGIAGPAANMLYTVVGPQSKYKVKHFIDTFLWRGGDAAGSWSFAALSAAGWSLAMISTAGIPLGILWAVLAFLLGRRYHYLRDRSQTMLP